MMETGTNHYMAISYHLILGTSYGTMGCVKIGGYWILLAHHMFSNVFSCHRPKNTPIIWDEFCKPLNIEDDGPGFTTAFPHPNSHGICPELNQPAPGDFPHFGKVSQNEQFINQPEFWQHCSVFWGRWPPKMAQQKLSAKLGEHMWRSRQGAGT